MRELTFRGFLAQYVKSLSKYNTMNLSRLTEEAASENPRLREPLALYVIFSEKQCTYLKYAESFAVLHASVEIVKRYTAKEVNEFLTMHTFELAEEYHKAWRSYQSRKNRFSADVHTKSLMRSKVLRLQNAKQISNYRIYTDLKLNPGNINAWLKYGAAEKISLSNARRVLEYVQKPEMFL